MGRPKVKRKYNRVSSVNQKAGSSVIEASKSLPIGMAHVLDEITNPQSRIKLEMIVNSFTLCNRESLLKEVRFGIEGITLDKLKGFLEATSG